MTKNQRVAERFPERRYFDAAARRKESPSCARIDRLKPVRGDWPSQGGKPSRSHRLSGEGAKGLRSQRGFPLVRVHGGQGREVVDTRRRVVLHSTSKDLVAEQIQQVQDGRANGLPSP